MGDLEGYTSAISFVEGVFDFDWADAGLEGHWDLDSLNWDDLWNYSIKL